MQFDPENMSARDVYFKMVQLITPRPIAWVSTVSATGVVNLAPYSFFNGVGGNPPTVVFCPANNRDGQPKDTLRNIEANREFVINVVPFSLAEHMNQSAAEYDADISEVKECGLTTIPSFKIQPPRLAEAPAAFECTLNQIVRLGEGPGGANMVVGQIEMFHVSDNVINDDGTIDSAKLDTIGRLGGTGYVRTTDRFDLDRPQL